MNIDWAVTCRYAESDGGVATLVGAGVDVHFITEFPATVGMMMAVRLAAPPEELAPGHVHPVRCRVLDPEHDPVTAPDGSAVPTLEIDLGSEIPLQQLVPGWLVNPLVTFGVQWWAREPGTYTVEVLVDDQDPHLSPYHVIRTPA